MRTPVVIPPAPHWGPWGYVYPYYASLFLWFFGIKEPTPPSAKKAE